MTEPEQTRFRNLGRAVRDASHPQNVVERRMSKFLREPPSVRLAASVIVTATLLLVVLGGVAMRVFDHPEYGSVWVGMWWVLQTVTTVGFGDYTPKAVIGRILTSVVMLWGIAFLTITTAAITSVFVARAEQERALGDREEGASVMAGIVRVDQQLAELAAHSRQMDERLEQMQKLLEDSQPDRES